MTELFVGNDQFASYKFDYIISNPPLASNGSRRAQHVERKHFLGKARRFVLGLPRL